MRGQKYRDRSFERKIDKVRRQEERREVLARIARAQAAARSDLD